ncbi:MAG: biotin transporter BioY [Candidatus Eisenbacteria bacterium]
MSATRSLTLADIAWPRAGLLENTLLVIGASLVTGLCAQIAIPLPFTPVPVTGQTFAVLLCGATLGARRGFMAQIAYLAQGAMGLPVFAGGVAGAQVFAGPTAGYLIAFPFAAALTGWLAERAWDRRFLTMLGVMLLGSCVIFVLGAAGLARFLPVPQVFAAGVFPFLPGDVIKTSLAALVFPRVWRWVTRDRGGV